MTETIQLRLRPEVKALYERALAREAEYDQKNHTMPTKLTYRQQVEVALSFFPPEKHQEKLMPIYATLAVADAVQENTEAVRKLEAVIKEHIVNGSDLVSAVRGLGTIPAHPADAQLFSRLAGNDEPAPRQKRAYNRKPKAPAEVAS